MKLAVCIAISFLVGCSTEPKFKVYLYKDLSHEGKLATFHSNYPDLAQKNCEIFANLHEAQFKEKLICSSENF